MSEISLELLKKHVNADDSDADDDILLQYLEAAEEHVVDMTRRSMDDLCVLGDGVDPPKRIVQAVLMLAASWYAQRESVAGVQMYEVPDSVEALVKPFRRLV